MSLPVLDAPTAECTLPSTKVTVKYRPFTVKEEKILLLAAAEQNSKSMRGIYRSVLSILEVCTFGAIDVKCLSTVDFEYLFIKIKTAARGEIEPQIYRCIKKDEDGNKCDTKMPVDIDFDKIKLNKEMPESKIKISDDLLIQLNYPTISQIMDVQGDDMDEIELLAGCIDMIVYKDIVYSDFTKDEINDFIDQFTEEYMQPLTNYFKALPKLTYTKKVICSKCKGKHTIVLEGLHDFFG